MAWELIGSLGGGVQGELAHNFDTTKYRYKFEAPQQVQNILSVQVKIGTESYNYFNVNSGTHKIVDRSNYTELSPHLAGRLTLHTRKDYPGTVYLYRELTNQAPAITVSTTDARTLYENDTINVGGTIQDSDVGNVMMVKYQINNGTTRTIHTSVSDGSAMPFNRVLTFRGNKLYDGNNAVTGDLQQGAQHVIKVWAEDDQGGRSADILRTFQVVPNRPATLTIEPIAPISGLIDSDSFTVNGNVSDPDGNTVKVEYKIGGGVYSEIYNGSGGAFNFTVKLADLIAGNNTISIRATDAYGATTVKSLNVAKSGAVTPLKESIVTYRITPPNGTASGVLLWLERDSGDLDVNVEISMTAADAAENWVPMTKNSTAYVDDSVEEDEWSYEADAPYEKILVRLTLSRTDANSTAGVRLISGVLS